MQCYISYSIRDNEKYLISLLCSDLQKRGFGVDSGFGDRDNKHSISRSDMFLGFVFKGGKNPDFTLKEFEIAKKEKVPAIIIIEQTVHSLDESVPGRYTFYFNRNDLTRFNSEIRSTIMINPMGNPNQWMDLMYDGDIHDMLPFLISKNLCALINLISTEKPSES